jgi:Mrp family chromosome partitioning ATPase/capsular polysaccharide biosynthesis protein
MTVREFIRTVWAGKWYVLAAVLVVVAGATFYVQNQETVYRATATVQITSVQSSQGGDTPVQVTVTTGLDDVTSEPVVTQAADELGSPATPESVASSVTAEVASEDGALIAVNAESLDPDESVDTANAVATAYVAQLSVLRDAQSADITARMQALSEKLASVTARLGPDPTNPLVLAEQDAIVTEYKSLITQNNTLSSITTPGVVATPATSAEPLGLGTPLVLAIALLAGLVAGIGIAFARRGLDLHVRTAAEASRLADAPVLAELYEVRAADKEFHRSRTLPISSRVATPFTESIRELRTAVQVSLGDTERIVVVVTAVDPHAPRSFIAANLAASFALSGRRTIAVSGDLRRPQLDRILPPPEGWSGGDNELRPTAVHNLSVFPVPVEELDPADYLATAEARRLVDDLRGQADVVVIDAPPVLAAADATILGGYAHGVVLLAAAGQTDRAVLTEAAERLRINNVPLAGLALAGVKGDRRMLYASTYGADASAAAARGPEASPGGHKAAAPQEPASPPVTGAAPETSDPTAEGTTALPEASPEVPERVPGSIEDPVPAEPTSTGATDDGHPVATSTQDDAARTGLRGPAERAAAIDVARTSTGPDTTEPVPPTIGSHAQATAPGTDDRRARRAAPTVDAGAPASPPTSHSGGQGQAPGQGRPLLSPEWSKVPTVVADQTEHRPATDEEQQSGTRRLPFRW